MLKRVRKPVPKQFQEAKDTMPPHSSGIAYLWANIFKEGLPDGY
jgi:hypothetical protein